MAAAATNPSLKVGIDFCDLGRVINGRPEDPVELRPFARAFTSSKIQKSVQKLGLGPISLRTALAHPRVRDDNADGARTDTITNLQHDTASTLSTITSLGFNAAPLTVTLPPNVVDPVASFIAPPSDFEEQWKRVKAAGGCAGAHWAAVGARAFNAPEVVGPALERVQEKAAEGTEKQNNKAYNFAALRETASRIMQDMLESRPKLKYSDLRATALKSLISYSFNARKESGASKVTGNKASCIAYLEANITMDELQTLINSPPNAPTLLALPDDPTASNSDDVPAAVVLALPAPKDGTLTMDVELPPGLAIQSKPPDWLAPALVPGSETASLLVGKYIVYRWPARIGGWLVGKVVEVNTDPANMVGETMANFKVFYDADGANAHHLLSCGGYAQNNKPKLDAWAILA